MSAEDAKTDEMWRWFTAEGVTYERINVHYSQPSEYEVVIEPHSPFSDDLVKSIKYHRGLRPSARSCIVPPASDRRNLGRRSTPHGIVEFREYTESITLEPGMASPEGGWSGSDLEILLSTLGIRLTTQMESVFVEQMATSGAVEHEVEDEHPSSIKDALEASLEALPLSVQNSQCCRVMMHPRTWFNICHVLEGHVLEGKGKRTDRLQRLFLGYDIVLNEAFAAPSPPPDRLSFEPGGIIWAIGDFTSLVVCDVGLVSLLRYEDTRGSVKVKGIAYAGSARSSLLSPAGTLSPVVALRSPQA